MKNVTYPWGDYFLTLTLHTSSC